MFVKEIHEIIGLKNLNVVPKKNNRIRPQILIRQKKIIEPILKPKEKEKIYNKISGVQLDLFANKFN
jgi:hypothetical protein